MKKVTNIIATIFILFLGFNITAQSLRGNGNVVEKEYHVNSFEQLNIDGVFNTWLKQGTENKVIVEADENIIPVIEVVESNGELTVRSKKKTNIKKSTKMNVYITLTSVEDIIIRGVGNLICESELELGNLTLKVSSVGSTSLLLNCEKLDAEFSAVGNIDFKGTADSANLEMSGTGNLNATEFEVGNLILDNSGIGNVKIYATETLEINSSGIGNVRYKGGAELKNFNVSGIGKVKKM